MRGRMKAPIANRIPKEIIQHGQKRIDHYDWIRDVNWEKFISGDLDFANKKILEYISAENSYKDHAMQDYKSVEQELYNEVLSRIKEDDESYPQKRGNYYYYSREEKGKNYSILCRKKGDLSASEEIYFDINKEAQGEKLYSFGPAVNNEANNYYAYFYNLTGSMEKTLKVRDLETGKDLDWKVEDCTGSFQWIDDENLYFVDRGEGSRGQDIYRMNVKQGPTSKKLVFSKPEEYNDMFLWLDQTNNKEYFAVYLSSGATHVLYVSKAGTDEFSFFIKGEDDVTYSLEHHNKSFYILTNCDGANDFKVMTCDTKKDGWDRNHWNEYLAETPNECINEIQIYNDYLILVRKNNNIALNEIVVCDINSKEMNTVKMPNVAYDLSFDGAWDHKDTKVWLEFNSPINPKQTLELDLLNLNIKKLHEEIVPNFDSSKYTLKREMAKGRDGVEIPLTIVHLKDLKMNKDTKAHVYSYGSYGFGMPAFYSSSIFSLIDRGFVHCIAHIRGGDDKGFDWYLDGKMDKKLNTFYDFIDGCEYLCEQGYTSKGNIAINGGSAGGLLMGAVSNMSPDLFGAVVADVAFVDVINTISDEKLPLTPPEWEEWGNPIKSEKDFNYIMKYSPYDNIEAKNYPPTLYNSGISDEQVTYWEPTKMVAKLREYKTDDNLLLLNMKMHAGHAGASKKYEWIEEKAFNFSFILKAFNLN
jgi:oligopeptidase B